MKVDVGRTVRRLTTSALREISGSGLPSTAWDPMRVLTRGVPLTLLLDLVSPVGPASEQILASERGGPAASN